MSSYGGLTPLRIYTSEGYWRDFVGNDARIARLGIPLRLAHWDGVASLERPAFGGWTSSDAKQYLDSVDLPRFGDPSPNVCDDSLL